MLNTFKVILPHSALKERPIQSQRDEGWAEEWHYFCPTANQPASHPAAYLLVEILKVEYLSNHSSDPPQILNLSSGDQTKIKNA